jgi:hypothetical protein
MKSLFTGKYGWLISMLAGAAVIYIVLYYMGKIEGTPPNVTKYGSSTATGTGLGTDTTTTGNNAQ